MFKISRLYGEEPQFDSMPVAKVVYYGQCIKDDYRPYAQNIICFNDDCLFVRMWAFDAFPKKGDRLLGIFYMFKDNPDMYLKAEISALDLPFTSPLYEAAVYKGREIISRIDCTLKPLSGEDLQGIYWGGEIAISKDSLREAGGVNILDTAGEVLSGNFFKDTVKDNILYRGSFFKADLNESYYLKENMGSFLITDY